MSIHSTMINGALSIAIRFVFEWRRPSKRNAATSPLPVVMMQNAMPIDILEPEDLSDAVAFLVSDQAKWITGVSLPVDAGFSVR